MHLSAALCAEGLVLDLFSAGIGGELPAADYADKSLLAALCFTVLIEGLRIAVRAMQFSLSGFL
jgi:hypothetical protein